MNEVSHVLVFRSPSSAEFPLLSHPLWLIKCATCLSRSPFLAGPIPSSLGRLVLLEELVLSSNNLSGEVDVSDYDVLCKMCFDGLQQLAVC